MHKKSGRKLKNTKGLEAIFVSKKAEEPTLGGGNSNIFYFHPYFGEDSHFD